MLLFLGGRGHLGGYGSAALPPEAQLSHSPHTCIPTDLGGSAGGATGRHWVLDPIDGTRGFVGMRQYSVCLGMLQDGEVELGLLGCPNLPQVGAQHCGMFRIASS